MLARLMIEIRMLRLVTSVLQIWTKPETVFAIYMVHIFHNLGVLKSNLV